MVSMKLLKLLLSIPAWLFVFSLVWFVSILLVTAVIANHYTLPEVPRWFDTLYLIILFGPSLGFLLRCLVLEARSFRHDKHSRVERLGHILLTLCSGLLLVVLAWYALAVFWLVLAGGINT